MTLVSLAIVILEENPTVIWNTAFGCCNIVTVHNKYQLGFLIASERYKAPTWSWAGERAGDLSNRVGFSA